MYTDKQIIEAIPGSGGVLGTIADKLGCHRNTIQRRRDDSPEIQEALANADREMLDIAEKKLFEHVQDGNMRALSFYLGTKGKNRGYTQKTEITGDLSTRSEITILEIPDNKRGVKTSG